MLQHPEIDNEDLYNIFKSLERLKTQINKTDTSAKQDLVSVLDEVLKLRAEVEKLKANYSNKPINE